MARINPQSPSGPANLFLQLTRVLKNKHQAVSQGVRRFAKRSISIDM
jgi:hypothetical protein